MLFEGGPWALIILVLSILSLVPTLICVAKRGNERFFFLSVGISLAAFSFSVVGTGMGLYELGVAISEITQRSDTDVELMDLFARGLGISMIPLIFGAVFFALNMFLLGVARFLKVEKTSKP